MVTGAQMVVDEKFLTWMKEAGEDQKYTLALDLVRGWDSKLEQGYHMRDRWGRVLLDLNAVVNAALAGRLGDG